MTLFFKKKKIILKTRKTDDKKACTIIQHAKSSVKKHEKAMSFTVSRNLHQNEITECSMAFSAFKTEKKECTFI